MVCRDPQDLLALKAWKVRVVSPEITVLRAQQVTEANLARLVPLALRATQAETANQEVRAHLDPRVPPDLQVCRECPV